MTIREVTHYLDRDLLLAAKREIEDQIPVIPGEGSQPFSIDIPEGCPLLELLTSLRDMTVRQVQSGQSTADEGMTTVALICFQAGATYAELKARRG